MTAFLFILFLFFYLNLPKFGHLPDKISQEKIKNSPHYKKGKFQNITPTVQITSDEGALSVMADFLFKKHLDQKPKKNIPAVKTDLKTLDKNQDLLVWFGHSSYYIQLSGFRFLIDPVFSQNASPIPMNVVAFKGATLYTAKDMPSIDFLIITHDHWDHLDYPTIKQLKGSVGRFVVPLGIGSHLRHWGIETDRITELDWNEKELFPAGEIDCLPARHFSGRSIFPSRTLWASFLINTPEYKLYIGGDSGYDGHYKQIGDRFGGVDLALLDSGQYDKNWKEIHQHPAEVLQAAKDLQTKRLFAGHNSKFCICNHAWYDPLERISELAVKEQFALITPKIGEVVSLRGQTQSFDQWWKELL
ncbi:MAG: MBL fold metallo-hydrolase [Alphaproteobacteria bacterium]|nr:MBL fold metallo-hydrolase [Alphaproteobacteria bacterium]